MSPRVLLLRPLLILPMLLTLLAPAARAAEDPTPFPDMARVVGELLKKHYYDAKRFQPRVMVERALRALEQSEMAIHATWQAGAIVIEVGGVQRQQVVAPEPASLDEAMDLLEEVRGRLAATTFTPSRRRELEYALLNGALLSLDPHTVLMPPEPAKEFGEEIQGEFYGIGAYLQQDDGVISIERVMPGLPAERAGVEDGDVILRVDGESTMGLSLEQTVKRIKGPKGTTVVLTLERKAHDQPVELPIVRDSVKVIATRAFRSGDVGYIRMDEFSSTTHEQLWDRLGELQRQGPLAGLVLDLRFNGGGLLDAAKSISTFFLPRRKEIVRTVTIDGPPDTARNSKDGPFVDVPMVVLVSGGSASAAEILSGALQRNDRAVVAGTATFGKGSVQAIKPLRDGAKLKLTIQEYQLPGGVSIQDVGVVPDVRLVRHSVRKDGSVDLLPFTREREGDDEFALRNSSRYDHASTFDLGWLAAYQTKEEGKRSSMSARDFQPDLEATLAIDLLKAAAARPGYAEGAAQARKDGTQRQFLLEQLRDPVAKRAEAEAAALSAALAKRQPAVTWGGASVPSKGALSVTYVGPGEIPAGERVDMRFQVRNEGGAPAGRLYGLIHADKYSPLWEEELVIGEVGAGQEIEAVLPFRTPPRLYDGEERFTVDIYVDGQSAPVATAQATVQVRGTPRTAASAGAGSQRPHFSYAWAVEEPGGDGQLAPGETGTVLLTLKNDGDAASTKVKLFIYKSDDPFVQLGEVRFLLEEGLQPDTERTLRVPLTVLKEVKRGSEAVPFSAEGVKLQIRAEESFDDEEVSGVYRSTLFSSFTIPINQPLAGRTVTQPTVTLIDAVAQEKGVTRLRVRVSDDNPRYIALFQDDDKVDLKPASVLAPAEGGARSGGIYEVMVALKPGLNNVRVVVSDEDEVTDVLPVRLWGATPATPVSASTPPAPAESAVP